MTVKLLTEHHLEFLSLKGGCIGSFESIHVKMPHCWKSHVVLQTHALDFKSVCNKEHKGVICNMTSSSTFSQSTCLIGRVLWEELLILSRVHS